MSIELCPACTEGDHSGHIEDFTRHGAGLIRDAHCQCNGGCTDAFTSTIELPRLTIELVLSALHKAWLAPVSVQYYLQTPYPDDPRWTPWTRWIHPMALLAHEAETALKKAIGAANHG